MAAGQVAITLASAATADLAARDVPFDRPLQEQPWGTEAVICDPDGNRIVLQQAA